MKFATLLRGTVLAVLPVGLFVGLAWLLPRWFAARVPVPVDTQLRALSIAEPVGRLLARYCQSDPALFPRVLDHAWLPEELGRVRHGVVELGRDRARVEFGTGRQRYGYVLVRDGGGSTRETNHWRLEYRGVEGDSVVLLDWSCAAGEAVEAGALLTNVIGGYARQLRVFPADESAHRGRIRSYLWFGRPAKARQACREMLGYLPEGWWPNLANGLIEASERGADAGERFMEAYVERRPGFLRLLDLAYFHECLGQPGKAAAAVNRALAYDANVTVGHGGDSEYRGFHAALYLHRVGQHEASVALCDKLQAVWINGEYAKAGLRRLRSAAERGTRGEAVAMDWPSGIPPFDPFEDVDLPELLGWSVARPARVAWRR